MATQPNAANGSTQTQTTFLDLFLALIYAGTILLFLMWVGAWKLPDASPVLIAATRSVWSWAISGVGGALLSIIFYRRLSNLILLWTAILTVALAIGTYFLRKPCPTPEYLAGEQWEMHEGNVRTSIWNVMYSGDGFSCPPDAGFSRATTCKATGWGNGRGVYRYSAPNDGNVCVFFGTLNGNTISGDYTCKNGGPYPWNAKILSRQK